MHSHAEHGNEGKKKSVICYAGFKYIREIIRKPRSGCLTGVIYCEEW